MRSPRLLRRVGSIGLGLFILAGLPGAVSATAYVTIGGTITDKDTGLPIAGLQVKAVPGAGGSPDSFPTAMDGTYLILIDASSNLVDGFVVQVTDPQARYTSGSYSTLDSDTHYAHGSSSTIYPGDVGVAGIDMKLTLGKHITGKVLGPGNPPNPLANIAVLVVTTGFYSANTLTAADGAFSLTVPDNYSYAIAYMVFGLYQMGCYADGFAPVSQFATSCNGAVVVGDVDLTGIDAQLPLAEGDTLTVAPASGTVAAGSSQAFTATLAGPAANVHPAEAAPPAQDPDVTDAVSFSISGGGTCVGHSCTPPVEGDYTVTATYGSLTGETTLHAGPPAAAAPSGSPSSSTAPSAAVTPPPTSTSRPDGGGQGSLPATMLLALAAAAALITVRVGLRSLLSR